MITLTSFSESPLHLLTIDEAEILKKVVLHSVATALANNVFPVPANWQPEGNKNNYRGYRFTINLEGHIKVTLSMEKECLWIIEDTKVCKYEHVDQ